MASGCAAYLEVFPSDTALDVEVQRAPDSGGSPDVGNAITLVTIRRNVRTVLDEQPLTYATFHYRTRHVGPGRTPGPWTGWTAAVALPYDDLSFLPEPTGGDIIPVVRGGTGVTDYSGAGALAYAISATAMDVLQLGAAGTVLRGGATAPSYGTITNSHIDAAAAIVVSKLLAGGSTGHAVINTGSGVGWGTPTPTRVYTLASPITTWEGDNGGTGTPAELRLEYDATGNNFEWWVLAEQLPDGGEIRSVQIAHDTAIWNFASGKLYVNGSPVGSGAVTSVFGRSGAVVAVSGDYTFAQIGSTPTTLAGYGITDAAPISHTHPSSDIASGYFTLARGGSGQDGSTPGYTNNKFLIKTTSARFESSAYDENSFAAVTHSHSGADITSGAVGIAYGGLSANHTGSANFSVLYKNGNWLALGPNITTTKKYLAMTGTGAAGQAPEWAQVNYADLAGTPPAPGAHTHPASDITAADFPNVAGTSYRLNVPDAATATALVIQRGGTSAVGYAYLFEIRSSAGVPRIHVTTDATGASMTLTATEFAGGGAGVTGVNAAQLGGQAGSYYTSLTNATDTLAVAKLATGTEGYVLKVVSSVPTWAINTPTGAVLLTPTSDQYITRTTVSTPASTYQHILSSGVPIASPWQGAVAYVLNPYWENGAGGPSDPISHAWRWYASADSATTTTMRMQVSVASGGWTNVMALAQNSIATFYSSVYFGNHYLSWGSGYAIVAAYTGDVLRLAANGAASYVQVNASSFHGNAQRSHHLGAVGAEWDCTYTEDVVLGYGTTAGGTISHKQEYNGGNSGAALTWNAANGNAQRVTATGNFALTLSNFGVGTWVLRIIADGTQRNPSSAWDSTIKWAGGVQPTMPTTSGRWILVFLYFDGTAYSGSWSGEYA